MVEVDYGYGDVDYGYGDAAPAEDYGYGDASPDQDYGYGDASPDMDYGYGDAAPDEDNTPAPAPVDRRPKRRCSVTKFSLATETPLTAASVINDLRMGVTADTTTKSDDGKSAVTDETGSMDMDREMSKDEPAAAAAAPNAAAGAAPGKKGGMMSRIRRRLSIAM